MPRLPVLVVADTPRECAEVLRVLTCDPALEVYGPVGAIDALDRCSEAPPALAVVHVELDHITGPELCGIVRGRKRTERLPLVLFSSRGAGFTPPDSRVSCADAYVSHAEIRHLPRRIRALMDTSREGPGLIKTFRGRHLVANFDRVQIAVDGHAVDLTNRELHLLQFLVTHANHVLTRHDILTNVWKGENDGISRSIDTHIRRLRVKLGAAADQIETVVRVGYRFSEMTISPSNGHP